MRGKKDKWHSVEKHRSACHSSRGDCVTFDDSCYVALPSARSKETAISAFSGK